MRVCHCTLPLTNPDACRNCQNNIREQYDNHGLNVPYVPSNPDVFTKVIKRLKRTIEKYDKDGNYLGKEIVTEEELDNDVNYNITYTTDTEVSADLNQVLR